MSAEQCCLMLQGMLEAAEQTGRLPSPRTVVYDKKRKAELAAKLAQRWQRWELSNFDYLMQVYQPDLSFPKPSTA